MKQSILSFADGFTDGRGQRAKLAGKPMMTFDWDAAAQIIKDEVTKHPDLVAEAGLQGDWAYTGGIIFQKGFATNEHYTYLSSNWAQPTLILSWDRSEQKEIPCCIKEEDSRFESDSKWDDISLQILGNNLLLKDEDTGRWGEGAPGSDSYFSMLD